MASSYALVATELARSRRRVDITANRGKMLRQHSSYDYMTKQVITPPERLAFAMLLLKVSSAMRICFSAVSFSTWFLHGFGKFE